ncbi:MAG: NAD(P)H-dependent oxidoreductase subunit E [Deltaproteobacteria bacterium]|nr:NAD(P)H-dependent oxidoreductase subunit E [Deltaproteobacteria bacterium]
MHHTRDLSTLDSHLTPEVMAKVDEWIDYYRNRPVNLIPVLEACQEIVGYLPVELQEYIGRGLNIPGSTIYGVVTFYSYFSMVPKGRHLIKVCMGTACYVRGIGEVLDRIKSLYQLEVGATTEDMRFSLEAVRCLGACGLAPVMVVDSDTHGGVRPNQVSEILSVYK